MIKVIKCCPHCGSTKGIRLASKVSGTSLWLESFSPNQEMDNSNMYSGIREIPNKYVYCIDCNKRVCTTEEWKER